PRFPRTPHHLVEREEVAFLLAMVAAEGAEGAVLDADIGEVDVAVDHVGHDVARLPPAHLVGHEGEGVQLASLHLGEADAFVHRELAALEGTAEDAANTLVDPVQGNRASVQFPALRLSRSPRTRPSSSTRRLTLGRSPSSTNSGRPAYSG